MNNSQQASRVPKSMQLYERARLLIPGATQLVSRRPTRLAFGVSPVYAARAKGSRFWDVDGHEYIDWVSGIGAIILGYADPIVDDAVQEQIATGIGFSVNHELEIELAEALVDTIPCAEMVRFCKGGGEACAIAVRIARGVTGRDKILFRGYHGWHDWYLAANLSTEASLDNHLFPGIEPIGVPRCLEGSSIPFPYGDLNALGEVFDAHRGEIAAVIMEPLRSEMPPEGYLAGVKKLTEEHNTILIFDEVSTGFRPTAQGVQPLVGVVPNMAVFAKSISNGYPMGAVVGRRDVMELHPSSRRIANDQALVSVDHEMLKSRADAAHEVDVVSEVDQSHADASRPAIARHVDPFGAGGDLPQRGGFLIRYIPPSTRGFEEQLALER